MIKTFDQFVNEGTEPITWNHVDWDRVRQSSQHQRLVRLGFKFTFKENFRHPLYGTVMLLSATLDYNLLREKGRMKANTKEPYALTYEVQTDGDVQRNVYYDQTVQIKGVSGRRNFVFDEWETDDVLDSLTLIIKDLHKADEWLMTKFGARLDFTLDPETEQEVIDHRTTDAMKNMW